MTTSILTSSILQHPLLEHLGWALVHSVWQGAAAGIVLCVALALIRGSARARYVASCITLLLAVAMPLATFFASAQLPFDPAGTTRPEILRSIRSQPAVGSNPTRSAAGADIDDLSRPATSLASLRPALPWAGLLWTCGICVLGLRQLGGCMFIRRMRQNAVLLDDAELLTRLDRIRVLLRLNRVVQIAESTRVTVPCVIGIWRPMILVPCALLCELSPQHLESLLAHELSHVKRQDYLVNLLQSVVETLLFYHPAIWWISRQIRIERENCCDDMALQAIGSATVYGEALASMEELRACRTTTFAMAATGGSLLHRIQRILGVTPWRRPVGWHGIVIAMIAIILLVAPLLMHRPSAAAQQSLPTSQPATYPTADGLTPSSAPSSVPVPVDLTAQIELQQRVAEMLKAEKELNEAHAELKQAQQTIAAGGTPGSVEMMVAQDPLVFQIKYQLMSLDVQIAANKDVGRENPNQRRLVASRDALSKQLAELRDRARASATAAYIEHLSEQYEAAKSALAGIQDSIAKIRWRIASDSSVSRAVLLRPDKTVARTDAMQFLKQHLDMWENARLGAQMNYGRGSAMALEYAGRADKIRALMSSVEQKSQSRRLSDAELEEIVRQLAEIEGFKFTGVESTTVPISLEPSSGTSNP